jgi:hypothetical protein
VGVRCKKASNGHALTIGQACAWFVPHQMHARCGSIGQVTFIHQLFYHIDTAAARLLLSTSTDSQ